MDNHAVDICYVKKSAPSGQVMASFFNPNDSDCDCGPDVEVDHNDRYAAHFQCLEDGMTCHPDHILRTFESEAHLQEAIETAKISGASVKEMKQQRVKINHKLHRRDGVFHWQDVDPSKDEDGSKTRRQRTQLIKQAIREEADAIIQGAQEGDVNARCDAETSLTEFIDKYSQILSHRQFVADNVLKNLHQLFEDVERIITAKINNDLEDATTIRDQVKKELNKIDKAQKFNRLVDGEEKSVRQLFGEDKEKGSSRCLENSIFASTIETPKQAFNKKMATTTTS